MAPILPCNWHAQRPAARPFVLALVFASLPILGCTADRYDNVQAVIERQPRAHHDGPWVYNFSNLYIYPTADVVSGAWIADAANGGRAWNLTPDGDVPDGSFYQWRDLENMQPERFENPWDSPPPQMPFTIKKPKKGGVSGFIGRDATGRTYMVKMDHPDWPELSTSAEAIGGRIVWAMGYHVPPSHIVTIEGTGNCEYDGRRAVASEFVPGEILGEWTFHHYRNRREVRALRVVATWLNEVDHGDNNTLVTWDGRRATYWLIDFNSSLGAWKGGPKCYRMGWSQYWDPRWQLRQLLTLGLWQPQWDRHQPIVSKAVGRFDPRLDVREWRSLQQNPAYDRLTDGDAAWMVAQMQRLSREQLAAIVGAARYSRPEDERYVLETLLARREAIVAGFAASPKAR